MMAQRKSKLVCKAAAFVLLATAVLCCNLFLSGKDVYTAQAEVDENGFDIQDGKVVGYYGTASNVIVDDTTDPNGQVFIELKEGAPDDGQVYLVTYEIYDEECQFVGIWEHHAGKNTRSSSWATVNGKTENVYLGINTDLSPRINLRNWKAYFPEEDYNVYKEYTYKVVNQQVLTEKISNVTNISWDTTRTPKWLVWDPVEGASGYKITLKCDGRTCMTYHWSASGKDVNIASEVEKEGTYTIDIQVCGGRDTLDSDVATDVLTYQYVFPEEELGVPEKVWWTAKEGSEIPTIANWTPVVGAKEYSVLLKAFDSDENWMNGVGYTIRNNEREGLRNTRDFEWDLNEFNAEAKEKGMTYTYRIEVQALSGNIEIFANSTKSQTSGEYKTLDALNQELKDSLLADGLDKVIEDSGIEKVADAMMNDAAVLAEVAAAKQQHMEAKGVTALEPVSTVDGIDADNITVVGAGLNVEGGTVGLVLKEADSKIRLNSDLYHNVKQLDISLTTGNGTIGDLKVPVVITMDAPDNIAPDRLVILHAHNGEIEKIFPTFNEDGTMTFSVTGFSTFAFAGITMYDENGKEDIDNSGDFGDDTEPGGPTGGGAEPEPSDPIEAFVTRMYSIILEREPDAGSSTWINGLKDGSMTGVRVADGFVLSEEMLNKDISNEEFVKILYRAFFGREADAEGLATWKNLLDAGCKKTYVFAGFANSTEFGTLCAEAGIVQGRAAEYLADRQTGLSDADYKVWCFVERMYMEVLNRTADEPGVRSWVGALQAGSMTGVEVADGFIMSEEFLAKNMTDEEYVRIMYRAFFGRDADVEGLATWTNALATGWTKQEVFAGFANSNEFGVLCEQTGIVQGTAEGK